MTPSFRRRTVVSLIREGEGEFPVTATTTKALVRGYGQDSRRGRSSFPGNQDFDRRSRDHRAVTIPPPVADIPRAPEECVASGVEVVMGKPSRLANGSTSALCDSSMIYAGCPQPECLDGNPRPATSFIRCRSKLWTSGRHLMGEDEDLEILR
ncbi:hypothetical protein EDC04DRAFT_2602007 [Pisolithus marmoratus]|nr:hypothetical protein EDC04DRAFT_2602007 [Pisolithus marmoratus]